MQIGVQLNDLNHLVMPIRSINKYTVIKRFSLGKKLYDKLDTIYVQEHDPINMEPQKVLIEKRNM